MKRFMILVLTSVLSAAGWGDIGSYFSIGTDPDDQYKFCRASVATHPITGDYKTANQWKEAVVTLSTSATLTADSTADGLGLLNCCETTNYVWGYATSTGKFYRKDKVAGGDAEDWTEFVISGFAGNNIWSNGAGWIIFFNGNSAGKWSTDEGATIHSITTMPPITTNGGYYQINNAMRFHGSTAIIVEFDSTLDSGMLREGRKISRSIDGGDTWQTVLDVANEDVDSASSSHFHTCGYHEATQTWWASYGDDLNRRLYYSTNDGVTWTMSTFTGMQPVTLLDYGHPSKMMCGADSSRGVYWLDTVTGYNDSFIHDKLFNTSPAGGYCWIVRKFNGMYYAFGQDNRSTDIEPTYVREPRIFVSSDAEHWATYYQFSQAYYGVMYVSGLAQSKIHASVKTAADTYANFTITEAQTSIKSAILIEPAVTNVLSTQAKSVFIGTQSAIEALWTVADPNTTMTVATTGGLGYYNYSAIFSKTTLGASGYGSVFTATGVATATRTGENYYGVILAKGNTGMHYCDMQIRGSAGASGAVYYQFNNPDVWHELQTLPETITAAGSSDTSLRFYGLLGGTGSSQYIAGQDFSLTLGGAQLSLEPGPFQVGGTARPLSQMTNTINVGTAWTSYLTIFPDSSYKRIKLRYKMYDAAVTYDTGDFCTAIYEPSAVGKTYKALRSTVDDTPNVSTDDWVAVTTVTELPYSHIKTWDFGFGNWLVLILDRTPYYDADSNEIPGRKFKLLVYLSGTLTYTMTHDTPIIWARGSQIDFAVAHGSTNLYFYIKSPTEQSPQELTQALNANVPLFRNRNVTQILGDTTSWKSMTFWTPVTNQKEFATTHNLTAVTAEMNNITYVDSPAAGTKTSTFGTQTYDTFGNSF